MTDWKEKGIIRIADDVVSIIARIAALDTKGVTTMSGGFVEGLTKRVSGNHSQKGIHVVIQDQGTSIDLRLIIHFGEKIDQVCRAVQYNVKETVENMTGLVVEAVNIRVDGISHEKKIIE